jgi:type I restriction enzyme M protein
VSAVEGLRSQERGTRKEFQQVLGPALAAAGLRLPTPAMKTVWAAVSIPDPDGEVQRDSKSNPLPDPDLRDAENVPLDENFHDYLTREVLPHVPDAWIDETKTKIGYEIPFTRQFYVYTPPRPLAEIDAEIKALEAEIQHLISEVTT